MSRENRRRAAATGAERPAAEPRPESKVVAEPSSSISWLHCMIGLLAGEAVLVVLSNVGLRLADAAFGATDGVDGGIVGMASLLSVMFGGYLAARLAGRAGMYQGIVVAIGFIMVAALWQFQGEASIVSSSLHSGTHTLVDLGPMDMGGLMSGDLLALFGGTVGGLLSGKR